VVRLQDAECRARRQGTIEHHIDAVADRLTCAWLAGASHPSMKHAYVIAHPICVMRNRFAGATRIHMVAVAGIGCGKN
jgi:hypothetical protein